MPRKSKPPPPPPPPKPASLVSRSSGLHPAIQQTLGKRGLCWPWDQPGTHFALFEPYLAPSQSPPPSSSSSSTLPGKISWLFNWELWQPDSLPQTLEWVPCIRTSSHIKDIDPFLLDIITKSTAQSRVVPSALLGFNEPEIPSQANLDVETASVLWKDVVVPAKSKFGLRLGSPGMSSDMGRSKPWLDSFLAMTQSSEDPKGGIDFLVLHWYGFRFVDLRQFLEDMHQTYGLPVWLNEFACSKMGEGETTVDEVCGFLREALPWLDACPWIEKYAYFGHKDVGEWVGRASNFLEMADDSDSDWRLTRVAKIYCEY
ncbi:hypothetical protein HRR83_002833 [Exophiala dermatitidis]|uniref:Asl1-like glycosyl hydrolase catalytic domain-containing protein n=2 Tax=Exophiala dermatitidis TaxID=5970 RepID=H6C108_EXODN|nr:uncharacterized protein HMPREF1120_05387 [Exophiala dermatitidis NIH/UT8656]KAJ4516761.1 hypothetical protein HRR75_003421 [Exophiala dermatitidis]EHY57346.1 hypothetical protein HMPREF1120_05387 [Exophiala dermatitidis NIH/UT8656]KAJ4520734.1 hypothetical protein HRR74_003735 [Exophiala dermatitidis]KAJ4521876.1 hypothetical protein HRR73_003075 [Exophiala dermatitidis]KAJ4535873.1 hypothetical protein HRR78_008737 [Exophiala dermatitidis]